MSTPIEIVRRFAQWREDGLAKPQECPLEMREVTAALASVLDDAERFKALERAHEDLMTDGCWAVAEGAELRYTCKPLSELADRLRKET